MEYEVVKVIADSGDESSRCEEITLVYGTKRYGSGTFGIVREAELKETGEKVAVKISNITETTETKEVQLLKKLKHCNIINMLYHFRKANQFYTQEYIIMESMPNTLSDLSNGGKIISEFDTKLYMYQLLRGLAYMHAKNLCHRDVKPENVLIDTHTGMLKLCDFGTTRKLALHINSPRTGTLHFLAPEMVLGFTNYTKIIDMWSAGCILIELLKGGKPFFGEATNEVALLGIMMNYFGTPTETQFSGMKPTYLFFTLPKMEPKPWSEIVSPYTISDEATSLCSGLLCYSPSSRLLPHEALAHRFFDELRSPETTHLSNGNPLPPLFNFQPGEFPGGFDHLIPDYMREQ